jgi:hypothetical protein
MADNMVTDVLATTMPQAIAKVDSYITSITNQAIDRKIDIAIKNGFDHRITRRLDEGIKESIAEDGRIHRYVDDCIHANNKDYVDTIQRHQVANLTNTRMDSLEESLDEAYRTLRAELKTTTNRCDTLDTEVAALTYPLKSSTDKSNILDKEDTPLDTGDTGDTEETPLDTGAATEDQPDVPPTAHRFAHVTLSPVKTSFTSPHTVPKVLPPPAKASESPSHVAPPTIVPQSTYKMGSIPTTPQPRNHTSFHRDKYALQQRISRKDILRLANSNYHRGPYGLNILDDRALIECGYTTAAHHGLAEVMICYNDIITIHRTVHNKWSNDRYGTDGPQISRIVSKELAAFPRLLSTSAEDVVDFYDRFHEMGVAYLLPTTPLDAIILQLGYEGLFPPALGTMRYSACGKGLLELLQHLVPTTLSPAFNAILGTVRSETANGYDLLWRMLCLYVPGFNKAKPIVFPFWT